MLSSYLRLLETALEHSDLEPRLGLISALILCASAYSFRIDVAFAVISVSIAFSPRRVFACLVASLPFIAFFAVVSLLLGGLEKLATVVALVCAGSLLCGVQPEKFGYALMSFGIPPRIANSIVVAMRMFQLAVRDIRMTSEALSFERGSYLKLLRAFTAVLVLRSIAISEVLYSRGFDFDRRITLCERPKAKDWALLSLSILVAIYTCLTRSAL